MGLLSSIASALGGGAGSAVTETVTGVANVVEKWAPTEKDKADMTVELNKLVETARAYNPTSVGTGKAAEFINVFVDSLTRLIRPAVTVIIFGGLFGFWHVGVKSVDPWIVSWGQDLMAFWFGSRTLLKDLPAALKTIKDIARS